MTIRPIERPRSPSLWLRPESARQLREVADARNQLMTEVLTTAIEKEWVRVTAHHGGDGNVIPFPG